ncbi:unnamed protein product [Strongylus vulgaris]|uniref:Uncharacterized protein n=1 Tax=Strongylus vulgaris TaxID=40348 RepID=A0A3P7IMY5_STRVU|nr:unnamed protein product [Strongylus vulgaris]
MRCFARKMDSSSRCGAGWRTGCEAIGLSGPRRRSSRKSIAQLGTTRHPNDHEREACCEK